MATTERDVALTAPDGVTLLVDHHPPKRSDGPAAGTVVWIRTPYGRRQVTSMSRRFTAGGADVVIEAMRGSDGSGGTFDPMDVTPRDAAVVLDWIRRQPWFDGTIVTWGLSAIGYASWALAELDVPEWRLAVLQDAPSDLRDLIWPGGAFAGKVMLGFLGGVEWQAVHPRAGLARTMLASIRYARRAGRVLAEPPLGTADRRLVGHRVDYFQQWLAHEHDDEFWAAAGRRRHAAGLPGRVHLATGWYDVCLAPTLADYRLLRDAGRQVRLTIGPWYHGRGAMDKAYRDDVDRWVRAARHDETVTDPPVRVFVGGVGEWRDLPDWPSTGDGTDWHLHPGGGLRPAPAPESVPDRYRYDPADPTPSLGGAVENFDGSAGAKDNRALEARPDVLTYTGEPLATDLEVIGPLSASIVTRSDRAHVDLVVRLCDVAPDGRSTNLADGARRLRPDEPGAAGDGTRAIEVDLAGVAHVFRAGHRLRLQVSSGAHPRLVRNPGSGEPAATATALHPVEVEILHDPAHPSTIRLPVS